MAGEISRRKGNGEMERYWLVVKVWNTEERDGDSRVGGVQD